MEKEKLDALLERDRLLHEDFIKEGIFDEYLTWTKTKTPNSKFFTFLLEKYGNRPEMFTLESFINWVTTIEEPTAAYYNKQTINPNNG